MRELRLAPGAVLGLLVMVACANAQPGVDNGAGGTPGTGQAVAMQCEPSPRMPVEGRASPFDSATVQVGAQAIKVCYGRPSARDREVFGGLVPYDRLWRTGANEPTIIHVPTTVEIAGVRVEPGSYSLYTEPGPQQWTVIINRSTTQWGHEGSYTAEVRAQEAGRGMAPAERLDQHVEQFTIRGESTGAGAHMILEWERTRVRIPVRPISGN
jgi:hypothetical protein